MIKQVLFLLIGLFFSISVFANATEISDFKIENINNQLVVIILDENGLVDKNFHSDVSFIFNGFEVLLSFSVGASIYPSKQIESTLTLIKVDKLSKVYLLLLTNGFSIAYEVPYWILLLIPIVVLIIIFLFRKLIYVFIAIIVLMLLFGKFDILKNWFYIITNLFN